MKYKEQIEFNKNQIFLYKYKKEDLNKSWDFSQDKIINKNIFEILKWLFYK